jgi:hypothetical protein
MGTSGGFGAKVTEGEELLATLQAMFARLGHERKAACATTMTLTEITLESKVKAGERGLAQERTGLRGRCGRQGDTK